MVGASRRREQIVEEISRDGYVSLGALSETFGVSPVTIHRDLELLEGEGLLARIRGGARRTEGSQSIKTDFAVRENQMRAQKIDIARRAMAEIPDGATVFLDSSTTVLAMTTFLEAEPRRALTIVTNSPSLVARLVAPHIHVIVLPGELNQSLRAITGRWAVEFIEQLNFNVAFASAAGMSIGDGIMTTQRELAETVKAAFARSERRVALIDSSKFGVPALLSMSGLDSLDLVITDDGVSDATFREFQDTGLTIEIAGGK